MTKVREIPILLPGVAFPTYPPGLSLIQVIESLGSTLLLKTYTECSPPTRLGGSVALCAAVETRAICLVSTSTTRTCYLDGAFAIESHRDNSLTGVLDDGM